MPGNQPKPINYAPNNTLPGGQIAHTIINCKPSVTATVLDNVDQKYLAFSLQESKAGPGDLFAPVGGNDTLGWYIESVEVFVWCQPIGTTPDKNKRINAVLQSESPNTINSSGHVDSNMSFSIGGNIGMFGETPTGGVSAGLTVGTSFGESYLDFTFYNKSVNNMLHHVSAMTMNNYDHLQPAMSLWNRAKEPLPRRNEFWLTLPALAVSNVPLVSQGVFLMPADTNDKMVEFCIEVVSSFVFLDERPSTLVTFGKSRKESWTANIGIAVDLGSFKRVQ